MDFIRNLFSRKDKTGGTGKDTVVVSNIWGSPDGKPFVLPRNPDVSALFATLSTPELNVLKGAYLRHPDSNVRLATISELKKREKYHLRSQELVDLLADVSSIVRSAAAQAIWLDDKAVDNALRCLRDEIHRTGFKSTMSSKTAQEALETLRKAAPSAEDAARFEEWVNDIIGIVNSEISGADIMNLILEHLGLLNTILSKSAGYEDIPEIFEQMFLDDRVSFICDIIQREIPRCLSQNVHSSEAKLFSSSHFIAVTVCPWLLSDEVRRNLPNGYLSLLDKTTHSTPSLANLHKAHWIFCTDGQEFNLHLTFIPSDHAFQTLRVQAIVAKELLTTAEKQQLGIK